MGSEALCFRVVRPAVRAYVSTYDHASVSVRAETFSDLLAADFQFFFIVFLCFSSSVLLPDAYATHKSHIPTVVCMSCFDLEFVVKPSYRPGGGETICPPPMAVRLTADLYVRPRTGRQSAHG